MQEDTLESLDHLHLKIPPRPPTFIECHMLSEKDIPAQTLKNDIIQNGMAFPFSAEPTVMLLPFNSAKLLTFGEDVKKVIDISINTEGKTLNCFPGDTFGIIPKNVTKEVEELLACLKQTKYADNMHYIKISEDTSKKNAQIPPYLPTTFTLKYIFETCVDIRAIPKKAFLRTLSDYTTDAFEKRRLEELCSQQGSNLYTKLILNNGMCLLDILKTFPSCVPPIERLLENLPRLQARPYSLAFQEGNILHFAITVVEEGVGGRKGLCSGWLNDITSIKYDQEISDQMKNMTLGEQCYHLKIPMYLRIRNSFRVPTDPSVSLIMISAGTGVAPFLGFLKYRADLKINSDSIKLGYSWLFYGCRYKKRDFLYRSEIEDFVATGILNKLSVSFSRDFKQNEGDSQNNIKYVQDNIRKEKVQFVCQLLADNNVTFLCGDAKHMAKDVQRCIICSISEIKGQDEKEAENIFKTLLKEGRYVQDVWL